MLVIDLREKKDDKFSSRPEMNTMGSDIYHLILQALIDDLHLSGFHAVWSATTTKKKKKDWWPDSLYFQQVLKLSYHRRKSWSAKVLQLQSRSRVWQDLVLWLLKQKLPKQRKVLSNSFTFRSYKLCFKICSSEYTGENPYLILTYSVNTVLPKWKKDLSGK